MQVLVFPTRFEQLHILICTLQHAVFHYFVASTFFDGLDNMRYEAGYLCLIFFF